MIALFRKAIRSSPLGDKTSKDTAQREAGRTFQRVGKPAATEYEKAQEAIRKNFERLKAERLARETAKSDHK
jgi:hypothetical protein